MTTTESAEDAGGSGHIVAELGFALWRSGDEIHGSADVNPYMHVPGTSSIRTSILATWADITCGMLAVDAFAPRVPVTLSLSINVHEPHHAPRRVDVAARIVKAGRSVVVFHADFTDETGAPIALGTASFMVAPNPALLLPPGHAVPARLPQLTGELTMPFAERARCARQGPGVAVLPLAPDAGNASNTANGGLIALAIEEAVLSTSPGATLSSLQMHYLRPVRLGPAVATAQVRADLATVEVRDAGREDLLSVHAVTTVHQPGPVSR
jgi:acyl-coenzyme A thioesterase PaaI-like protein